MAREKLHDLEPIENVFEIERYSNEIMQRMWNALKLHYLYETSDICAMVAKLYNEQLVIQENIKQTIDQQYIRLDEGMRLQLDAALNRYGYERIIKRVPEDSAMHIICRLHIVVGQLNMCSGELANEIQRRLVLGGEEEELDVGIDCGPQELAGVVD